MEGGVGINGQVENFTIINSFGWVSQVISTINKMEKHDSSCYLILDQITDLKIKNWGSQIRVYWVNFFQINKWGGVHLTQECISKMSKSLCGTQCLQLPAYSQL